MLLFHDCLIGEMANSKQGVKCQVGVGSQITFNSECFDTWEEVENYENEDNTCYTIYETVIYLNCGVEQKIDVMIAVF